MVLKELPEGMTKKSIVAYVELKNDYFTIINLLSHLKTNMNIVKSPIITHIVYIVKNVQIIA